MVRLRKYLTDRKHWDDSKQKTAEARAKEEVAAAAKRAAEIAAPHAAEFFNAVYEDLPPEVKRQRDTMATHSLGQNPDELDDQGIEASRHQGIRATSEA